MLMLCWFYCIPFAKLLYFASAGIFVIFAFFMLRRGIYRDQPGLRQGAFLWMFVAAVKFFIFDIRMLKDKILCGGWLGMKAQACGAGGLYAGAPVMLEVAGIGALAAVSFVLFHFYRRCLPPTRKKLVAPEDTAMHRWANLSLIMVIAMAIWTMAPWVGYLTVGYVPKVFALVKWQYLAVINVAVLLVGFWEAERCNWNYQSSLYEPRRSSGQRVAQDKRVPRNLEERAAFKAERDAQMHQAAQDRKQQPSAAPAAAQPQKTAPAIAAKNSTPRKPAPAAPDTRRPYMAKTWTSRDTLWLNVFLYLIALALSYVAHDILSHTMANSPQ